MAINLEKGQKISLAKESGTTLTKVVEDSYHRISADKLFTLLETQVKATDEVITAEAFAEKLHHHHH